MRVRVQRDDTPTRKHHIIRLGDMELSNGFGIRHDCALCTDNVMHDGSQCWICGPKDQMPTVNYF